MATYECSKCGMSVNATCGKCNAPLVNDNIKLDDGTTVQVSKCPNGHGKIKSPMCCGVDMSCKVEFVIANMTTAMFMLLMFSRVSTWQARPGPLQTTRWLNV